MGVKPLFSVGVCLFLLISLNLYADDNVFSNARKLFDGGQYMEAADTLTPYVRSEKGSGDAEAILLYGKCLDKMTEQINTDAERKCYRSGGATHSPRCMSDYAAGLNVKYGENSYEYVHDIITIKYTGKHFGEVASKFPKSEAALEAAYHELSKHLIGAPSEVISEIEGYLKKYPKGLWHKRALLLLARINEDIWYVHKKWSWMLYGKTLSEDELIIKAEPYRQEAIKLFKQVKGGEEGKEAAKELKLLLDNKTDGKIYGIINESTIEGVNVNAGEKQQEKK